MKDQEERRLKQLEVVQTMPGIAGHIACEIYDCQYKKQPLLAVQAALCIMSVLKAQIMCGPTNLGCNIFTVGTAGPGKGKDMGVDYAAQLLDALQLTPIYNYGIGSSVGFIEGLKNGVCNSFLLWDEFGKDMTKILDEKGSHPYLKAVAHELMKLYSRSRGSYSPQIVSGSSTRGNYCFYKPNVTILGITVPEAIFAGIKEMHVMDGLLPRFIYFRGLDKPEICKKPLRYGPSEKIVKALRKYADGTLISRGAFTGQTFSTETDGVIYVGQDVDLVKMEFSKDAYEDYDFLVDSINDMSDNLGGFTSHLLGRVIENVLKVAVIVNDSKGLESRSLLWAENLVRECVVDFIGDIDRNTAETFFQRNVNRAKKILDRRGQVKYQNLLKLMELEPKKTDDIIGFLLTTGYATTKVDEEGNRVLILK